MKPRKNRKRIDTKYQMPREEKGTIKENINFNDFSFNSWVIQEMYVSSNEPTGEDYKSKKPKKSEDYGLPPEVPKDDPRQRSIDDTRSSSSSMEEGNCEAEMPLEDDEVEIVASDSDDSFQAGYAAAVEEIMASIQGLLGDPIEMSPIEPDLEDVDQLPTHAMEISEKDEKPDFPDIDGDGDRKEPISKAAKDKEAVEEA
jgi:hypothetical protein